MAAAFAAALLALLAALAAPRAAAAAGEALPDLPLSSKQCWEPPAPPGVPPDAKSAWCRVSNLYLYRGRAYYLTEDAKEELPTVQYGKRPRIPQAILPARFRALLAPGVAVLPIEQAYLFRSTVQGKSCTEEDSYVNFGDGMTERITTLWMFLCDVIGHCSYADRAGLQLIDASVRSCRRGDPPTGWDAYPSWYRQVLSCMSDQPLRHLNGSWREAVVHLGDAWVGLGQRCRSHYGHCHDGSRGKLAPTPQLLGSWRGTLGECLGFPTDAAAPLDPVRVMIVDRTYESHRHLLNVNTLLRTLQQRYSPHRVQAELRYMEGLSVPQQFQLWAQQTVVVHVHGSSIGHWQGLPHGAVVVKIAPFKDTYDDMAYGDFLVRDYGPVSNLSWLPLVNSDPNHLHLATEDRPLTDPRYARFSDAEKLALMRADCAALEGEEKRKICNRAIKFGMNLAVKPEQLAERVDRAIEEAFAKQGRRLPPDLMARDAAGAAAAAGGSAAGASSGGAAAAGAGAAGQLPPQQQQGQQQQGQQQQGQQQQGQQQVLAQVFAGGRRLDPTSVAAGAAAAAGVFLLMQAHRRWLTLLPGRRKARPTMSVLAI